MNPVRSSLAEVLQTRVENTSETSNGMKTVVVTGASRGIGLATANKFLSEGWRVIGTYLNSSIPLEHENLTTFQYDQGDAESIERLAGEINNLDILVNNAGVLLDEDDTEVIPDKLRKTLEINLIGVTDLTERLIGKISPGGQIINISSSAGSLNLPNNHDHFPGYYPSYKISKTALNMYTKTLAGRLVGKNITVSSLHPGWVKTQMGGDEATRSPEEVAEDIFTLATSQVETGQFWHKGEKFPW
ncbi:SDR family NAD(P)-dependent oxidoreductase [Candidatus Parcubacteria bacterium]|nr:SDR family NAD(P)-dependent oxidoreductase [Candidatus Parcubacteria bacterium]